MAVEVGELEVVSPPSAPAAGPAGGPGGEATAPGPSGAPPSELLRGLALERSRDLRLHAD